MKRGREYRCDRCGETAHGAPPDEPPLRWLWAFGYEVHACSAACWSRVQAQHRANTGKVYITNSHADDRAGEWAEDPRPPAIDLPPAGFTIRESVPPPPRDLGGRRERLPTFLYFAQEGDDGPIKIGVSAAPQTRLSSLQVSNPRPLRILATRPGTGEDERRLHVALAQYRIRGEWFAPVPAVLAVVHA